MTELNTPEIFPVQITYRARQGGKVRKSVAMRAYEVYTKVYGSQEALITGGCRGGFSAGELIAFLYAYPFPKEEWSRRVDEAFKGMEGL